MKLLMVTVGDLVKSIIYLSKPHNKTTNMLFYCYYLGIMFLLITTYSTGLNAL